MGTAAIKHPVHARPGPSFVIFDIRALWRSGYPDVKSYKWRLNPVWHRVFYSYPYGNSGHRRTGGSRSTTRVEGGGGDRKPGLHQFRKRILKVLFVCRWAFSCNVPWGPLLTMLFRSNWKGPTATLAIYYRPSLLISCNFAFIIIITM